MLLEVRVYLRKKFPTPMFQAVNHNNIIYTCIKYYAYTYKLPTEGLKLYERLLIIYFDAVQNAALLV